MKKLIKTKRQEKLGADNSVFLMTDVPEYVFELIYHSTYSSYLGPSNNYLFHNIKRNK